MLPQKEEATEKSCHPGKNELLISGEEARGSVTEGKRDDPIVEVRKIASWVASIKMDEVRKDEEKEQAVPGTDLLQVLEIEGVGVIGDPQKVEEGRAGASEKVGDRYRQKHPGQEEIRQ